MLNVLLVNPGEKPKKVTIDGSDESFETLVGGRYEAVFPFEEPVGLVCNATAKLTGMELNRALYVPGTKEIADIIAGPFFLCGLGEEDFESLSDHYMERFSKRFRKTESFRKVGNRFVVYKQ